jgi:hypothetical protein
MHTAVHYKTKELVLYITTSLNWTKLKWTNIFKFEIRFAPLIEEQDDQKNIWTYDGESNRVSEKITQGELHNFYQ